MRSEEDSDHGNEVLVLKSRKGPSSLVLPLHRVVALLRSFYKLASIEEYVDNNRKELTSTKRFKQS